MKTIVALSAMAAISVGILSFAGQAQAGTTNKMNTAPAVQKKVVKVQKSNQKLSAKSDTGTLKIAANPDSKTEKKVEKTETKAAKSASKAAVKADKKTAKAAKKSAKSAVKTEKKVEKTESKTSK